MIYRILIVILPMTWLTPCHPNF